ncbi:MFS transporter [Streptosporangium pseudovulgare]|uniref:MFS transporter n=1 Tax=Streptosporangium pseudovulgare TaxID=35765 RepID=A0ABQ2QZ28_9ACTN|nr:MFS transporter [Streptosporangium pseudovulgare]GGQ05224.1 MFS transporter [Streptosporangium pseudovulgare]
MTAAAATPAVQGGPLRTRDFRLLWIGETTSMLGSAVAGVALPLVAVVTLGAGTLSVGLLTAAAWLPWLLVGLPAGAWVDRLPKRPVMLACNTVSMAVFASVPVAAWSGALTMAHLLAAATAGGVAKVFFNLAYRAYLPALVGDERLLAANTRLQGSESAAQVAGPGLAGLLAQGFGAVSGVLADAVSFGVAVLCLRSIRTRETRRDGTANEARPDDGVNEARRNGAASEARRGGKGNRAPRRGTARRRLRSEIRDGLRFVVGDPYLRTLTVFSALSNIALMGYQSIQVVFLTRNLGAQPGQVGVVLALAGAGGLLGAALAGRIAARFGTARGFLLCEAFAAPMLLLGPAGSGGTGLAFFTAAGFGAGAGIVASNILTGTFRQRYCPAELFGRITASTSALNYGAIPLGGLLGGVLGEVAGVRGTMWLMAAVQLLSLTVLLLGPVRPLRDFPASPPARSLP